MHVSGVLKELLKYIRLEAFVNNDAWILDYESVNIIYCENI